jgi:hypothetical protein
VSWTEGALPNAVSNYFGGAGGGGTFVTVHQNSATMAYSNGGTSWSTGTISSRAYWAIAYAEGKFMAIGPGNTFAAQSTDGINWSNTGALPANLVTYQSLRYGNGTWLATSASNTTTSSTDGGSTWSTSLALGHLYKNTAYGNGKWVAVSTDTSSYTCTNPTILGGATGWTQHTSALPTGPSGNIWYDIAYGNGKFVACGDNSATAGVIAYSTDGISWTQLVTTGIGLRSVQYGNGKFIVSGSGTTYYIVS